MDYAGKQISEDYECRLAKVCAYIEENLSQELSLDDLANVSNFSKFHFARLFAFRVGETPIEFLYRTRLERAAILLKLQPKTSVREISSLCGFKDQAVFTRAFKRIFSFTPSRWRQNKNAYSKENQKSPENQTYFCLHKKINMDMEQLINAGIKQLPELSVAYIRHVGDYSKMENIYAELFDQLFNWISKHEISREFEPKSIVIHHDDPTVTAPDKQRTSVCITVPAGVKTEGNVGKMEIPSGKHLVARFDLKPAEIGKAWEWIYDKWFPTSGYQPADQVPYQLYPEKPTRDRLLIEFCVPIKPR